jgi:methyl-accepting chemotaxis protein
MEAVRIVMSGMWLQDAGSLSSGNSRLLMFFVGLVAVAMVAQAIVVIVTAVGAFKASKRALTIAEELHTKVGPLIDTTQSMIHDSAPKVKVITENLVEASHVVRSKAAEFDATASELNAKARMQAARVDGMVTGVLNTTSEISNTLQRAVQVPVKEFAGLVNGFKAGLDVLVGRAKEFGRGRPVEPARNRDTEW